MSLSAILVPVENIINLGNNLVFTNLNNTNTNKWVNDQSIEIMWIVV